MRNTREKLLYDDETLVRNLTVGELKDLFLEILLQADRLKAKAVKEFLANAE